MSEDRVAPRTAAQPRDFEAWRRAITQAVAETHGYPDANVDPGGYWSVKALPVVRLAIEAEAASLDSDELRKAVEALPGRCHDGEGLGCEAHPCVENVGRDEVLALLADLVVVGVVVTGDVAPGREA